MGCMLGGVMFNRWWEVCGWCGVYGVKEFDGWVGSEWGELCMDGMEWLVVGSDE